MMCNIILNAIRYKDIQKKKRERQKAKESSKEPDFEEDEYIYDDLNLEEEEELYNVGIELNTPSTEGI